MRAAILLLNYKIRSVFVILNHTTHPVIHSPHIDLKYKYPDPQSLQVDCVASTTQKTGVEMEALVGCSSAALCIYDMCKALSHEIVITDVRLVSKTGGKSDVNL